MSCNGVPTVNLWEFYTYSKFLFGGCDTGLDKSDAYLCLPTRGSILRSKQPSKQNLFFGKATQSIKKKESFFRYQKAPPGLYPFE